MQHIKRIFIYIIVLGLAFIPINFLLFNLKDDTYIKNLMGNWFATMIGVIIGIPIALEIARIQRRKRVQIEEHKRLIEIKGRIKIYVSRVYNEILDNIDQFKELRNVLNEQKFFIEEFWDWSKTVVNAFSFIGYNDFQKSEIQTYIPKPVEKSIFEMYMEFKEIQYKVLQTSAAFSFYYRFPKEQEKSIKKFDELKKLLPHINLKIDELLDPIKKYNKELSNRV